MEGLLSPLLEIEMPMVRVLAAMESEGMPFDPALCASQRGSVERRLSELEQKSFQAAGQEFSLRSVKDVTRILFEELQLPPPPSAHQGKHQLSTKQEVLQELALEHPLPGFILEHRKLVKLLAGFVDPLIGWVQQNELWPEGTDLPRCGILAQFAWKSC